VSSKVTNCDAVAELPEESVAVHVTVVVPSGNVSGASFVIVGAESTVSVTVGSPKPTEDCSVSKPVASTVISDSAEITGLVVSSKVTNCDAVAELPEKSVAVHVTMVSPSRNVSGVLFVIVRVESTVSVIAGSLRLITDLGVSKPVASTVISDSAEITGLVVSSKVTNCVAVAEAPEVSDEVQTTTVSPSGNVLGASFVIVGVESKKVCYCWFT